MPVLGLGAWIGGLLAANAPTGLRSWCTGLLGLDGPLGAVLLGTVLLVGVWSAWRMRSRAASRGATAEAVLLVVVAVALIAMTKADRLASGPVADLADQGAQVSAVARIASDPRLHTGRFGDRVILRVEMIEVRGRATTYAVAVPVLVIADPGWVRVRLGSTVAFSGRLAVSDDPDVAAILVARSDPESIRGPDVWWRGAESVRASLRRSVSGRPDAQRSLVPALVVGDDEGMDPDLVEDFKTTGLTHLTAVSGTNLTLLVGFMVIIARWAGVRGRWLTAVAAAGIVGFLLLARAEPSVLRAAAMGTVGLLGMGSNGLRKGTRALGVAVVVLLLVDPWLATTVGFALSVLATAGILLLAPTWRDAMCGWLPRWAAEAIAIPAAAQLACTPLVAAISDQVSLVAVGANLLVAPAVGPATVLGLAGSLLGLIVPALGALCGTGAAWCVAWIVLIAEEGARLPGAAIGWGATPLSIATLTFGCVLMCWGAPLLLRSPVTGVGCAGVMILSVVVAPPTPGWPVSGWVLAVCDVGQGDALVLNAGDGQAVVVDTGPDSPALDGCLSRLDVRSVPLLVLTHFHADHIDGLPGVFEDRPVGEVMVSTLAEPASGAAQVAEQAAREQAPVTPASYGQTRTLGPMTLQVLWPPAGPAGLATEGSAANNASVVLLVVIHGLRMLLTGDIEPEAQEAIARSVAGLQVDVLKVPHHGSRHQDLDFLLGLHPRLALVSVGADNDYGHPAPELLAALDASGIEVERTDFQGDLLVIERDGRLMTETRR